MHFTRIRISGFKSFVEPAEFIIEPGMTGIVGPNGCGKSNLVEALRWVMGEASAKKMRGGEMDDVIFSGSTTRPARNLAEVSLTADNRDRAAAAAFNDEDELVVTRRIERGSGSSYRINGREVRAQDVKLLFADSASGAHSTAMVGQGEIGAVITAKPAARRALLEEAAGITGLHVRRHEAELRLRGAETNMERVDDALAMLEDQLRGLKRQARQAARYRNISGHICRAEAVALHHRWSAASAAGSTAGAELAAAERATAGHAATVAKASTAQARAAEIIPELREAETAEAARLHRLTLAREALDAEERRIEDARAEIVGRIEQIAADSVRSAAQVEDAASALARLDEESALLDTHEVDEAAIERHATALAAARVDVERLEALVDERTGRIAAHEARHAALLQRIADEGARIERLEGEAAALAEAREGLAAESDGAERLSADTRADARRTAESQRRAARAAAQARAAAEATRSRLRDALGEQESKAAALRAEIDTHVALSPADESTRWPPLIDSVSVRCGYEAALAAALGDDLAAAADVKAPAHWRQLEGAATTAALPPGAEALSAAVEGPALLARRLAQVGVVAAAEGARLQGLLAQGQRLVSLEGDLWRWDGYTVAAVASTAQSKRLARRERVRALRGELETTETALADLATKLRAAEAAMARATTRDEAAAEAAQAAETMLTDALDARAQAAESAAMRASRRVAVDETAARLAAEAEEAAERRATAETELRESSDSTDDRSAIEGVRGELLEARRALAAEEGWEARQRREDEARATRREAIADDRHSWRRRNDEAKLQSETLARRHAEAEAALAIVDERPAGIAAERTAVLGNIDNAEIARAAAADRLVEAEDSLRARERDLKAAEAALAAAREDRVRAEAAESHAEAAKAEVGRHIAEALGCAPDEALAAAGVSDPAAIPDEETATKRIERLKRERDNMGPVNLRAEAEAASVNEQFDSLAAERGDLEAAIARLRHGITSLNREGRQRLLSAFEEVNRHFGEVFARLFGGGKARLTLVDSDDPLEAGLEVLASPPGKRLQVLSLLSGGEQALTALALLFAVFSTKPAPVCVLDEVDAPLDDANVERFCGLVEDFAKTESTRFVVVTHNAYTMARMNRLFGVTMRERGVSQIVSVDLSLDRVMRAAE